MASHRKSYGNAGPVRIHPKHRKKIYAALTELHGERCFFCTRPFKGEGAQGRTLDHLTPLVRGGTHELSNLVLACSSCNGAKGDLTWEEYAQTPEYIRRLENALAAKPERPPRRWVEVIDTLEVSDEPGVSDGSGVPALFAAP